MQSQVNIGGLFRALGAAVGDELLELLGDDALVLGHVDEQLEHVRLRHVVVRLQGVNFSFQSIKVQSVEQ